MATANRLGPRIIVTGRPGSGKTSLGTELATLLRRSLFQLDPLVMDERMVRRPPEEIQGALNDVARGREWIVEGPPWYVPEHAWRAATSVIWLDMPRSVIAWRVFKRAFPTRLARRRVWGLIRHTVLADAEARELERRFVDELTPPNAELIRVTRPMELRRLVEHVVTSMEARSMP